jgi:hypothetical protein
VRFAGPAYGRAVLALDEVIQRFAAVGRPRMDHLGPLRAIVSAPDGSGRLSLEMARDGRVLGGTYALEVSTAEPVLPPTRGLSVRAKGIRKVQGLRLRARRGDAAGKELAERLGGDSNLAELLGRVHFEQVRIEPDGRPVIRHLGGSVVWILFPPLVRQIPFVAEQAQATVAALDSLAAAGEASA